MQRIFYTIYAILSIVKSGQRGFAECAPAGSGMRMRSNGLWGNSASNPQGRTGILVKGKLGLIEGNGRRSIDKAESSYGLEYQERMVSDDYL